MKRSLESWTNETNTEWFMKSTPFYLKNMPALLDCVYIHIDLHNTAIS